ncbi:MAG: arylsulfotransferase family protein [Holophagales bacterium]|nr:arylsulfotransferase family protein [Holophagales bacterium]
MWLDGILTRATSPMRRRTGPYGVSRRLPDKTADGYTLFCPAWSRLAVLIDMEGLVIHTWPVERANLVKLLPDGRLLTHNVGHWLTELLPDGSPAWRWRSDEPLDHATHHDFSLGPEAVWTLAKQREPVVRGFYEPSLEPESMRSDLILAIGRDGQIVDRFPFRDHLEELLDLAGLELPLRYRLRQIDGTTVPYGPADWAHANSLEVLPETPLGRKDERFRAGNLLFSLRNLDLIGVLDPRKRAVVWAFGPGTLDGQHHPTLLENGRILLFDNGPVRGRSVVRELDPLTSETSWSYEDPAFFSAKRGSNQRLWNGNTLICESDSGRILEVTEGREVVWEYRSPFVAQGERHLGRRIYRATRYSPAHVEALFAAREDRIAGHKLPDGTKVRTWSELLERYREGWT